MSSLTPVSDSRLMRSAIVLGVVVALMGAGGCTSSGVAPSKTASGAGTGALIGGMGGAVVGSNSSMGSGTGLVGGAAAGALIGGIVGMVQDAKDRREQDRLAQERAYQQDLAKRRAEEHKTKAVLEEELAIAEGFRISDIELADAKNTFNSTNERLKKLQEERAAALARKKDFDETREKTLAAEAEIARLEEELARLKGDEAARKASGSPAPAAPAQPPPPAKPGV